MEFNEEDFQLLEESAPLEKEFRGFAPEQMVRCEACLRSNAPTRASCVYCGAPLEATEATAKLQQPMLRPLEKWEDGFNCIVLPEMDAAINSDSVAQASALLRLKPEELERIISAGCAALPLARAATLAEAALIKRRLAESGINVMIVADQDLGGATSLPRRIRALELNGDEIIAYAKGDDELLRATWAEVLLFVEGRHVIRTVEVEERRGRGAEKEIVDAREMSADELFLDIYTARDAAGWRIASDSFDFSCLGEKKSLIAAQNFSTLVAALCAHAGHARYDNNYQSVRQLLSAAWPLEQHTEASGWRRERPGRLSTEAVTRNDNAAQFTRYSRLQYFLATAPAQAGNET